MAYTLEQSDLMASALRGLPPMDSSKRKLTKQALVRRLAREIAALQARGYTIEQVVESLHGVGLDITTPTLKSYLQRAKRRRGKDAVATRTRSAAPPPQAKAETPSRAKPATDEGVKRAGKEAFLVTDKDSY
jgi:hypothetical protein